MTVAEMSRLERMLWVQRQLRLLRDLGVRKGITLWAEWAACIAMLDKRVENRGWAPHEGTVGSRIAIHAGAHVGGRKGGVARTEGLEAIMHMAGIAGWRIDPLLERVGVPTLRWSEAAAGSGLSDVEARVMDRSFSGKPPAGARSLLEFSKGDRVVTIDTNQIPLSAIVAHARVVGVLHPDRLPMDLTPIAAAHPWYVVGEVGWILEDVIALDEPIPLQGSLGLWDLPELEIAA